MNVEQHDELCRLWQTLDRPKSETEVRKIMELVQTRANQFNRALRGRNLREYVASAFAAIFFGVWAYNSQSPLEQLGRGIVSAGALWILLFLWLMQRSTQEPRPECSAEAYKKELLGKYDRQILLTRTAWAWYVLPVTTGLVVSSLGNEHAPVLGYIMAGVMLAVGAFIAVLNWKASSALTAAKQDLQRLLESAG